MRERLSFSHATRDFNYNFLATIFCAHARTLKTRHCQYNPRPNLFDVKHTFCLWLPHLFLPPLSLSILLYDSITKYFFSTLSAFATFIADHKNLSNAPPLYFGSEISQHLLEKNHQKSQKSIWVTQKFSLDFNA